MTPQSDADGIAKSQTPVAGGVQDFALDGDLISDSIFTVTDSAHIIVITPAADETGRTFTVYGLDSRGVNISEALAGAAIAIPTTKHFKTVTQITTDDDTAGAITIGVSGLCVSPWVIYPGGGPTNIGLGIELSTSANLTYGVEHTFDDIEQISDIDITTFPHGDIVAKTANDDGNYAFSAVAYRCNISVWTAGSLTFNTVQIS